MKSNLFTKSVWTTLTVFILTFTATNTSKASHIMGGDINYIDLGNGAIQITMRLYRDCNGIPLSGTEFIDINSSNCTPILSVGIPVIQINDVSPVCPSSPSACNSSQGAYGVEEYVYSTVVTLPNSTPACDWVISWEDCCRNGAITTLTGAGQSLYIETTIEPVISAAFNNTSPIFKNRPLFYICSGQTSIIDFGAYDIDGDSLVYELVDCQESATQSINYQTGFSGTAPVIGTSTLDPNTGQLTITPTAAQVGVICTKIYEYRNGVKIGEAHRDIQVTIAICNNSQPTISGIGNTTKIDTFVCVGQQVCLDFFVSDVDSLDVLDVALVNTGLTGITLSLDVNQVPAKGTMCWTPGAQDVGLNALVVKAFDNVCPIMGEAFQAFGVYVSNSNNVTINSNVMTIDSGQSATLTTNMPLVGCTATWFPATGLSCTNCANPVASPTATTTYYATFDCNGTCPSSDSVVVVVNEICNNPVLNVSGINGVAGLSGTTGSFSTDACVGESLCFDIEIYNSNGSNNITATYMGNNTAVSLSVDTAQFPVIGTICWTPTSQDIGIDTLPIAITYLDCALSTTVNYTISVSEIVAGIDSTVYAPINIGDSVTITTTSDASCQFTWSPSATLSCSNCPNPIATPTSTTTYYATMNCGSNCTKMDSVIVEVNSLSTNQILRVDDLKILPNPSNGQAILQYNLVESGEVAIEVINVMGQRVTVLNPVYQPSGDYQYQLKAYIQDGKGVYFVRVIVEDNIVTRKIIIQ